MYIYIASKAMF